MPNPSLDRFRRLQAEAQALLEERNLPVPDESEVTWRRHFVLFCARVYHSFMRNRCPVRAAALAYTNLLALVPLLAVVISVSASLLKSQGQQSIQDWVREAIIRMAPMLGLKEAAGNNFAPEDLPAKETDFNRLVITRLETGSWALSRYLWDTRFSAESKNILTNQTLPLEERKATLAAELNKVVQGNSIYQQDRFARVPLSNKTRKLVAQNPQPPELARLNRWLLSDSYAIGEDPLESVTSQITGFVANFQSGTLGVSAVLALIFLAISLLSTVEATFNDMWGVSRGRGWFSRVVQYWAALTLGPVFLLSAVTLTTWAKVSHTVAQLPLIKLLMPFLVPLLILTLGCALLYLVMPNTRVPWRAALLGGLVAGSLLQLNSLFNVMYVSRVLTYRQIYGSMAALPLFLIGLYLSWLIVLLGAQVAYAYQNRHAYVQEKKAENVNQRGREFVALRVMAFVAQRFQAGQPPPTASEVADELRVPLRLVTQLLSALTVPGLVLEVAGTENAYTPGRPLEQITIADILQTLRVGQGQELATCEDSARSVICKEFTSIEQAWREVATGITLDQLVHRVAEQEAKIAEHA